MECNKLAKDDRKYMQSFFTKNRTRGTVFRLKTPKTERNGMTVLILRTERNGTEHGKLEDLVKGQ